jgi:arginyl-tRNA synthetase
VSDPVSELRSAVLAASASLRDGAEGGLDPTLERPPKPEFGDYSTNAAMLLAPMRGEQPRRIAESLAAELGKRLEGEVERVEVAGPGFLNVFLTERWYRECLAGMLSAGERFGAGSPERPERVLVEFVSANPTGPLTAASGRHAAYGDSLARAISFAGHQVEREYYVNDIGGQVELFAASIAARMRGEDPPDDGYGGDYVRELAERVAAEGVDAEDLARVRKRGVELMLEAVAATLSEFAVRYDRWFSELSLHETEIRAALEELERRGHVYRHEGATWLRTTEFGDDKDRVLIRSDGEPTYFAADIAYHRQKLEGGFDHLIDVLGADHHGYVARLRAAVQALGADPGRLELLIMQLVHLVERGERAQMSKRKGEFATLDELIGDIGTDAARFFLLQRSHDTPIDLDLELARRQSSDNPVYYVQYAHARIASILRKAGEERVAGAMGADHAASPAPVEPAERELIKRLAELPEEVRETAERRSPHRLCAYATAVAADFHAFYRDCKVIGAEGPGTEESRLALCLTCKYGIARTLGLLGVSAPERM